MVAEGGIEPPMLTRELMRLLRYHFSTPLLNGGETENWTPISAVTGQYPSLWTISPIYIFYRKFFLLLGKCHIDNSNVSIHIYHDVSHFQMSFLYDTVHREFGTLIIPLCDESLTNSKFDGRLSLLGRYDLLEGAQATRTDDKGHSNQSMLCADWPPKS